MITILARGGHGSEALFANVQTQRYWYCVPSWCGQRMQKQPVKDNIQLMIARASWRARNPPHHEQRVRATWLVVVFYNKAQNMAGVMYVAIWMSIVCVLSV